LFLHLKELWPAFEHVPYDLADSDESFITGRLPEIPARTESRSFESIIFGIGRGDDYHKCIRASAAVSHVPQDFHTALAGQIQVQQDNGRAGNALVGFGPFDKFNGFVAIVHNVELRVDLGGANGFAQQKDIGLVIFHDENRHLWARSRVVRPV